MIIITVIILATFILSFVIILDAEFATYHFTYGQVQKFPEIIMNNASHLSVELVTKGLNSSNMAFLGLNDILVLDGSNGKVYRITNGQMLKEPLIDLNAFHQDGLIGIAISKNTSGPRYVFLYLDEASQKYGKDVNDPREAETVNRTLGYDREGDRLYRYKLVGDRLVEPKLLFEIRAPQPSNNPGVMHHGGEVIIGPDSAVYFGIGDLEGSKYGVKTKAQNYKDGKEEPEGRAGILRVTQDGKAVGKGILGDTYPLNLYYAYGIRNSFGMDFDPVTGNLWITENGPDYGDEINLVEPGFNSGADILWGMSTEYDKLHNLVDFNGKGKYSDPEFVWTIPVGPTALKFFNSDKFGKEYENDMFVADFNKGNIYHFDLNENRTQLVLPGPLKDKVADKPPELKDIIFAKDFGGITDMQVGPDGLLYVFADGNIFKISPMLSPSGSSTTSSPTSPSSPTTNDTSKKRFWTTGGEMPTPRIEVGAAALRGKIYIVGGFDAGGNTTNVVEAYDPRRDTWTTVASLPRPLDQPAVAADDNKLYVVGGFYLDENDKRKTSDKLFIYDPASDKWKEGQPMPSHRAALTATFIDGILYAVGGDHDWESWSTNEAYDPTTNKWTEKAPMPTPRHHLSSALVDGKLYVIGGRYTNRTFNANLDANEVYDPKNNTWTSLQPMPIKRSGLAAAASSTVNGDIYVFGGESPFKDDKTPDTIYDITEKYDPETNKWTTEQPMPTPRHGLGGVSMNNKLYLIGGGEEPGKSVSGINEIFVISPSTGVS